MQQDISTVEKKVDSLIETCTLITNRAEEEYAKVLRGNLDDLNKRWLGITNSTEKQKENLRTAGEKFHAIDAGVKDIADMLNGIDNNVNKDDFSKLDKVMLERKLQVYKVRPSHH